ncbi:MAG: FKBP-type peptidyl-prolyl cis-trans isomerase [Bacteroidota bacterium]
MYKLSFYCLIISIFFLSCDNSSSIIDPFCKETKWFETAGNFEREDEILMSLSAQLLLDTSLQAYKDQNTIVSFAIDHSLDIQKTTSGLYYVLLSEGEGELADWGDYVSAHYRGYFLNGETFDSSCKKNEPLSFYIGNMITGWNEGLQILKPGGKVLLLIPSRLAYGEEGLKDAKGNYLVPQNEVLAFDVELVEIL